MIAGVHSPVRVAAALLLVALAPGAAALPWLAPRGARVELALLVAASLGFCAIASEAMLWLHVWDPTLATCVLAALCLVGISGQLIAARVAPERGWRP
jgi:hypothetical protein